MVPVASQNILLAEMNFCDLFQPRPYSFTYEVKDDFSGTDFSRAEERSGQVKNLLLLSSDNFQLKD